MNDDELFAAELRKQWGAPRPAPGWLRARVLSLAATPARRRWTALSAAAAVLVAATWVGVAQHQRSASEDELTWFVAADEEVVDPAAYFDLAALGD